MLENAKPIWTGSTRVNHYIEAKQSFCVTHPAQARLLLCAETEYEAHLNGSFVGSGQYRSFRGTMAYDEYDVTQLLREGENVLTVTAYSEGENAQTYEADTPLLRFALMWGTQTVLSGEETLVREHPRYESGRIEKNSPQLGYTYHYDASAPETPWEKAHVVPYVGICVPRPVEKCVLGPAVTGRWLAQGTLLRRGEGTPAQMIYTDGLFLEKPGAEREPGLLPCDADGRFFLVDLGRQYAGLLSMELDAPAGTVVDIGWGEHIEDLRVRTAVGNRNFACRYVCREGRQRFLGCFRRLGGRYLQVHVTNMTGDVRFYHIGIRPQDYPLARETALHCGNRLLDRLSEVSAHTLKLCMHEHYEDCPWREQALYAFDSYMQMLCGYYLFGEYDFARESLRLLADSQRPDGMIRMCAPTGIPQTIPSFSLTWILSLERYVLYSGDLAFGREMLPKAERVLCAFPMEGDLIRNAPDRKQNWNFYEWTEGLDGEPGAEVDAPINCFYIMAAEAYGRLCGYLGAEEKPVYHAPERMRRAIYGTFFDQQRGVFRSVVGDARIHELTQALAICAGVTRDRSILKKEGLIPATLSTLFFKYEALLSDEHADRDAVLDEMLTIWGKMLLTGTDTLWEVTEGAAAFEDAGSLCHGWSAVPVYFLYRYYLGYAPTSPGFREYRLEPQRSRHYHELRTTLFRPGAAEPVEISF